ncbi:MFS transporter [Lactiplantibacillus mudanjiangensis]|uniref:Transport protein [Lactobacillus plantarum JDM1] n=1 Tax=Lactiplantibacillus mudanjiangensis TaxID=1296538 RepID=A0A660E0X7_9LACO|nr:MFS transporter [Lactiplantibacillus mudanjiangensis]VDG21066.1 transport protein [Lactobacillus plantarum JDM1] [Lactiplantibacillus mudanjiangensis]VDG25529.1 transport protein [Lactobacillus plantarum JDM1] [Lactiplantibacillus mudanjiangensis]VDG29141.1 transport protein [Lactobacillus plantarum JDM1] [Lactiplantibacillus mudanjiangensis]VDG31661.1 transport protein [Lactobacillus plantarum JDM1] [Lactiplantibacillus mudanjiangensis]
MKQSAFAADPQIQKHRWWILVAVCLFTFMSTLDGSIVNIALPVMSKSLAIPMNQAEWVVSIYLIVICALLLLFGKLGDKYGKIRIFKVGSLFFIIGSLLCGFNSGLAMLLGARVLQAVGAAMTMSTNNGIITEVFPFQERGRALGMIGSFVALGSIAGPGIGGLILAHLSWGYIFWINVPVGIIALILGQAILPKDVTTTDSPIDKLGAGLFAIVMVTLFAGVFVGQEIGFTKPAILALFAVALVAIIGFVMWELRIEQPILALHLFKNSRFSISILCAFLIFVVNFFFNVISPFYLENARGLAANYAGYALMTFPIVQVIVAPIAGSISDKIGPELLTFIGLVVISISQVGYLMSNLTTPLWLFMSFIGLVGLGNGIFQAPNNSIVMSSVAVKDLGVAGGINALARELGMVIGISVATTVLFSAMSQAAGYQVTAYLPAHPEIFIAGMRVAFSVALVICLIATVITGVRLLKRPTTAK